ncbi:hypothetical protein CFP65_5076 [Kitasatospora sp. MMS16-BH015]|uniref:DUF4276 family protein n=1 Tax=Kitasatospora sp. MMS16-BH015 TaxID=2018025 RepID=UPI000CA2A1F8|nr:DUF4276 family protein [Kitasatospora sp. MMS16-BH015]AUG79788.1 hypothetical protein CFP65_5076 [Kitasatospora sp. MMS16-BH015]
MGDRPLVPALVAEGPSDEPFLATLIVRQLEELLIAKAPRRVQVFACEVSPVRITGSGGAQAVIETAWELAQDCDLIFAHSDEKERDTAEKLVAELHARAQQAKAAVPVVLVPIRMTESWMLADRQAIARCVAGADLGAYPYKTPADVEKAHNSPGHPAYAKQVWQAIAGCGHESTDLLAQHIDLRLLSQLPSYQRWLADTEEALKAKGFL